MADEHLNARLAFKAGWRTNADNTQPSEYLDGCERVDWEEFKARGLTGYLDALLTTDPDERCGNCRHCFGPIVSVCTNEGSEFCGEPVSTDGYCSLWAA